MRTKKRSRKKPLLGTLRGKIQINDPDWWKPMTDSEVENLFGAKPSRPPFEKHSIRHLGRKTRPL
jgi:hypothetical protein